MGDSARSSTKARTPEPAVDPREHNEGDTELDEFLTPLLQQAGGSIQSLEYEFLNRALGDGTLLGGGAKLWNALHSDSWRHREAAAHAYLEYLSSEKASKKYLQDPAGRRQLFQATMMVAKVACLDKLLQIYFIGLKTLNRALNPPICTGDIPAKLVNREAQPFVTLLAGKIQELNFRARDISLNSLLGMFKQPQVDIRTLVDFVMEVTEKGPPPHRAPWRIILARLEILHHILTEFGADQSKWDWYPALTRLVLPSLNNANPDVRIIAIEIVVLFYRAIGEDVRTATKNTEAIKNNIRQLLTARMLDVDGGTMAKRYSSTGGARTASRESEHSFVKGYELESEMAVTPFQGQALQIVDEQQEAALDGDDSQDQNDIVVPLREPITGQAQKQEGKVVGGKLQGSGAETYHDGSEYKGNFEKGQKEGSGRYVYADGAVYSGDFKHDKMEGQGTFEWPDGRKYSGSWLNNQLQGQGEMRYADGSTYTG